MEYVIAFLVLLLVVMSMACGVILTGKRIKGSCGGVWQGEGGDSCRVCGVEVGATCIDEKGKYGRGGIVASDPQER